MDIHELYMNKNFTPDAKYELVCLVEDGLLKKSKEEIGSEVLRVFTKIGRESFLDEHKLIERGEIGSKPRITGTGRELLFIAHKDLSPIDRG